MSLTLVLLFHLVLLVSFLTCRWLLPIYDIHVHVSLHLSNVAHSDRLAILRYTRKSALPGNLVRKHFLVLKRPHKRVTVINSGALSEVHWWWIMTLVLHLKSRDGNHMVLVIVTITVVWYCLSTSTWIVLNCQTDFAECTANETDQSFTMINTQN